MKQPTYVFTNPVRPAPATSGRLRVSRRSMRGRWRAIAVATFAALLSVAGVSVPAAPNAFATVPGTPGAPQEGTPVYTETFSNQNAAASAINILNYTGGSEAAYSTYTADPAWTPSAGQCNGWIMSWSTPSAPVSDAGCQNNVTTTWPTLRAMASALGIAQGQTALQAQTNQVLTEYTNSPAGTLAAGTEFQTRNTISAKGGHYYAVSAYFAAVNCPALSGLSQPKERFSLLVNGTPLVLSSGLNPCKNNTDWGTQVTRLQSAAYMVPFGTTANLGLSLFNEQTIGAGNDVAFDLPQILDVTPQLDKAFDPAVILNGSTSKMTLTVTNTKDLAAKNDWYITDYLPSNLRIASTPNVGGTCVQRAGAPYVVSAPAGGIQVDITGGDLAAGQASCTITIDVTSTVNGTYVNGPANISTNLNPPNNAFLEVIQPSIDIVKKITAVNGVPVGSDTDPDKVFTAAGDVISYSFVATNTTPKAATNTTVNTSLTNVTITEDAFSGAGDMSTLSCTPPQGSTLISGATMTCTATYVVQQDDVNAGVLTNRALATGTPAVGPNVTDTDDETIGSVSTPELLLEKFAAVEDADQDGLTGLGDHIIYTFHVINSGNVTLSNVGITDDLLTASNITVMCSPTTLTPGMTGICSATAPYLITQADVEAKEVTNVATAMGEPPTGYPVVSNPDDTLTPIDEVRIALQIEKVGESEYGDWVRMDGSSFSILEDVNGEPGLSVAFTFVDVETGLFQIDAIPAGTYWLSELTAPDGFNLLAQPVQFTISPDRTVSITGNGGGAVSAAGQLITVRDVPAFMMPTTGGTGTLPFIVIGLLLVLGAGGMAAYLARRRSDRAPKSLPSATPEQQTPVGTRATKKEN